MLCCNLHYCVLGRNLLKTSSHLSNLFGGGGGGKHYLRGMDFFHSLFLLSVLCSLQCSAYGGSVLQTCLMI